MQKLLKLIKENFFFLGIGFLLFFIPVYPKFPLFGVKGTYVSIRLEDIFVAIVVGLFFLNLAIRKKKEFFREPLVKLFLIYFSVGLLSIISAFFITKNISLNIAFFHFVRRIEYISLFFVTYYSLKNLKQLAGWGWIVLIASFLVIIYGLGQKFFGWPVVSTMNREFSKGLILKLTWWARINSTFAGHYDLAAYIVMLVPLVIVSLMLAKRFITKAIIFVLGLLCYYVLILTASRVSFAAYLISVFFVLFAAKKRLIIIPWLTISILLMIFSGDLGQRYAATFKIDLSFLSGMVKVKETEIALVPTLTPTPTLVPVIGKTLPGKRSRIIIPIEPTLTPTPTPELVATGSGEPIEATAMATSRSTDIRLKVEWPRAIRAFAKNPLLGTGYSSITLATDNDYLRMLGETGLLGSLAFLVVFLEIARRLYFCLKENKFSRKTKLVVLGITGSAVGYFLNATFIDVFEASKVAFFFWILMGAGLKVIDIERSK